MVSRAKKGEEDSLGPKFRKKTEGDLGKQAKQESSFKMCLRVKERNQRFFRGNCNWGYTEARAVASFWSGPQRQSDLSIDKFMSCHT